MVVSFLRYFYFIGYGAGAPHKLHVPSQLHNNFFIRERQSAPLGCILSGIFYIVVLWHFDICSLISAL